MLKRIFNKQKKDSSISISDTETDRSLKVKKLKYKNYQQYIDHQGQKLHEDFEDIFRSDREYEVITKDRFKEMNHEFTGKSVICLGARLGGEVKAFKQLGSLAIGIDVNPGEKNEHVLFGDFHKIAFPNEVFNFAFSNVIDHVYDVKKFAKETARVLAKGGILFLECGKVPLREGRYEVIDTTNLEPIINIMAKYFTIESEIEITNKTSWIDWSGTLFTLRKR